MQNNLLYPIKWCSKYALLGGVLQCILYTLCFADYGKPERASTDLLENNFKKILAYQETTVTGKVTSLENAEGIPGVNVLIKGTSQGTITDIEGNYSIDVPSPESVLVFSSIGYVSEEIVVGTQSVIDVSMAPDITSLEEIVVVGYGEQKRETLTGSVASIEGEEITKNPSPNVANSLAGRLPGLAVNQRSGEPGRDDPNILIRGSGTFGDNAPLIIIDGVQRSNMSRLNPEDIESISVLKDASAAIYGARAANGVILITTKMGSQGKPVFDFSYNHAFQRPTKILDVLDAPTFAQVFNEGAWYRAGRPNDWTPFYTDEAIQRFADGSDPVLYPNTNWVDEVLKPYSTQKRINLSATGGTEAIRYFLSFGSTSQDGSFKNDPTHYQQYNMRVKVDVDLTDNLTIGANLSAILNNKTFGSVATDDDAWVNFHNIYHANPTLAARYPNGLIAPGRLGENPLLLDQRGYITRDDAPIYSTFTAAYDVPFLEGLKLQGSYNYDLSNQHEKRWRLPYFFHEYNVVTEEYDRKQGTGSSSAELWDTYRKWTTELYNFRINYNKTFNKHSVGLLLGTEQQTNTHTWAQAYRRNFVSSAIDQIDVGSNDPEDKNNAGSATIGGYNNYFGRLNYDFEGKYLLEFLFRYDGSQIFPEEGRYGFFPGVSAGWRLSEEPFISNLGFVNQLKIRASYGQIGNDRVGAYQYLQAFSFGDNYVFGGSDVPGVYPNVLPNPDITWEVSEKMDVGIEGALWDRFLGFELTLWRENRSNILSTRNVSISNVFGFSGLPDENIGEVKNRGFELMLTHQNSIGQLDYQISANTAFARNEIIFMDEVPQDEPYKNQTGHPVGAGLFYQDDGIFNTQEELDAYPHLPNTQVGDIKIVDLNNDGEIDGADQFRFDYTSTPEYIFGMTMDLRYKSFDLNVLFQGQANAYNYDDRFAVLGNAAFDNATVERARDRWTVDNPNGTKPRADGNAPGNNTMWLFDATFVRLKSLEFGYSLPQQLVSKVGLNNARFYVSGFNLLTWAKEIKWADPEANGGLLYYPQLRVINMGVNVKF
ncbi:SusC/RagA family TonB-linked outer membrane protein [Catalinimonas niigatensis]|uniref:SusC/RagA family TonB-linked outer membrane protein n=1 Tax=Catalinimonas niigatensis TaxID=1397264 RepID=UPI002667112C|nr:TonB-dependent receptor [Catalinimonas niigatensis]WPP48796.1 TonB-dependent receptor [Catalinimonas niigatensis]